MLRKENMGIVLMVVVILMTAVNFQVFRGDEVKDFLPRFFGKKLQELNDGRPFASKKIAYAPDQILVKFKPSVSTQYVRAALSAYKTKRMKKIPKLNVYQLKLPEDITVEEMVYIMNQNPDIEYAEPNYKAYIATNDTFFKYQYALQNTGQKVAPESIPGAPTGIHGADTKAVKAWTETKGDEEVLIAVIDTGVDLTHADIKNKIFSSGKDIVNDDNDATDDNGHGTWVAGIAAAETNNDEGIAGVAWNCKILPIKAMDKNGEGWDFDVAEGIEWAVDNGADVINLSLGVRADPQVLKDAVQYAFENGVVVVAAAGNNDDFVHFPAAYDDYCLAVAATDWNDEIPGWSNYGPEVDVAAPGEWVVSLYPEYKTPPGFYPYIWGDGTSASTPHVAGLAALIKSLKPWLFPTEEPWLGVEMIMNIIRYSADDVNSTDYPGIDEFIGYGRINMEKALVPIKITTSARQ